MLAIMLAKRSTLALGKQLCERSRLPESALAPAARGYSVDHEKRQHAWRQKEEDAIVPKTGDDPEKPKKIFWFPTAAPKETNFSIGNIVKWYRHQKTEYAKVSQSFDPQRHEMLGADLATAHFLVHRGGRVRFWNSTNWTERSKKDTYQLPNVYDPSYVLEAVDVNGIDLHYEGLSNFCGLTKLKWLSLKDCENVNDWGLDKISGELSELEYLDISGCSITERGLECLYRMANLKKLIVTNRHKSVAFELSCFMLEDCIPGLICEILIPKEEPKD